MNKNSFIVGILVVFILGTIAGYALTHRSANVGAASPTGTTNTAAKFVSSVISLATASGTSTSILNNSGFDWAIISNSVECNTMGTSKTAYSGAGLANLLFKAATTSTAIAFNIADSNTNYAVADTVATSTVDGYTASSTEGILQGTSRIWPNNTYLTWQPNATNTASCTVGAFVMAL